MLADLDSAPIGEPLRATLRFVRAVTRGEPLPELARALHTVGVTRAQIDDALGVCWAFNTINRLADTFGFELLSSAALAVSAKMLLSRGYQ